MVPRNLKEAQISLNFQGGSRDTARIHPLSSNSCLDSPRSEAREDLVSGIDTLGTRSPSGSFLKGVKGVILRNSGSLRPRGGTTLADGRRAAEDSGHRRHGDGR